MFDFLEQDHGWNFGVVAFLSLSLGACASPSAPEGLTENLNAVQTNQVKKQATIIQGSKVGTAGLDTTRFIDVNSTLHDKSRGIITGQYVRLLVDGGVFESMPNSGTIQEGAGDSTSIRRTKKQRRIPLARAIWGQSKSQTLVLKVEVNGAPIKATTALFTVSNDSGRGGESSSTSITGDTLVTPYFLATGGSAISTTVEFRHAEKSKSQVLATVVKVLGEATKAINPGTKLATQLSGPAIEREAESLDKALGQLFSRTLDEATVYVEPLPRWSGAGNLKVRLLLPEKNDINGEMIEIGTWTVRLSNPKPSIFSDYEVCPVSSDAAVCKGTAAAAAKASFSTLDPGAVLRFPLTNQVSLYDHLARQAWFSEAVSAAAGDVSAQPTKDGIRAFCSKTKTALSALPLSEYDALAGLWAMMKSGLFGNITANAFNTTETCKADIDRMRLFGMSQ